MVFNDSNRRAHIGAAHLVHRAHLDWLQIDHYFSICFDRVHMWRRMLCITLKDHEAEAV